MYNIPYEESVSMNEDNVVDLFSGMSARAEVKPKYKINKEPSGYFAGFEIKLDLEIAKDTQLPPLHFYPIPDTNLVNVKCYFCHKERTFTQGYHLNSTWSLAEFKNDDERAVMVCSPYCPTLLPEEQRHLLAYDNFKYKSIYTGRDTYLGQYKFKESPTHDLEFRADGSVWNRCYFCGKEEITSYQECFYLPWENLNFPTGETIRVCDQNCIPPTIM